MGYYNLSNKKNYMPTNNLDLKNRILLIDFKNYKTDDKNNKS